VNASDLVTLSASPPNHLTDWDTLDWCGNTFFAILGWILVAVPVAFMHHLEMKKANQPPAPPETPVPASERWDYVVAVCIGLGGAFLGGSYGWTVARHITGLYLLLFWWMLPFICSGVVALYWFRWAKLSEQKAKRERARTEIEEELNRSGRRWSRTEIEDELNRREIKRSSADIATTIAILVYWAVGILIVGADVILRLAAQVALSSDTTIVLLLIGILGWLLWIYVPRRRANKR
jgi:hypothetical protein